MHVLTIIGNRPQFVKLAAVSPLLRARHTETLIHTGQHHDRELSSVFFEQLGLPDPDHNLGIAGGSNSQQTARMLEVLEPIVTQAAPDVVLVYGDTNSTLAGALVAAQLSVPLAHVEAGLRSFDRAMPEEVNRVVCDALSDLLLAPGPSAAENLAREGVAGDVVVTGDVMGDVVLGLGRSAPIEFDVVLNGFFLVTAHRAANVDDPARLARLVDLILSLTLPVIFPVHPRTRARLEEFDQLSRLEAAPTVTLAAPLDYASTIALAAEARAVLTDSGGLQKESVWLGTQCITLRPNTEWVETLEGGWNTVVDLDAALAAKALLSPPLGDAPRLYNAGSAGMAVVAALEAQYARSEPIPGVESA
ncbi:MAG: UDP-N-acetylglucosamine 2-epimerase (non-hydrolyzing) [Thermoleophilaceae bacterium]|nr:UDP-N-acetylglucosamine 2-epimerase (non-hydrolyzing) [Thermoleophilaceae bacterium]